MLPLIALLAGLAGGTSPDDRPVASPEIRLTEDGAFEVVGLDRMALDRLNAADLRRDPPMTVAVAGAPGPMLGTVRVVGDRLRFQPRYPVRPGTTYRATFRPGLGLGPIETDLTAPEPEGPESGPPRVVAVYPTGDRLPENLLRFYLHFSSPMSRGEAYRRLRLLGPDGTPVVAPFLELDEELWDPTGTRLTLLIDPGRIKQGLIPRQELGPVLESGRSYTLEVAAGWPDADGRLLPSAFRKPFEAGPADETPPDPTSWRLDPPPPGTRSPLVVRFPEPLDHALTARLLAVRAPDGRLVPGAATVDEGETRWSFVPAEPWCPGPHRLEADTDLEDRAGNAIGRPFEVDVFDRIAPRVEARAVSLPVPIDPE